MTRLGRATLGFVMGAAATLSMTAAFWVSRHAGLIDELPPHKAVRSIAPALPEPRLSFTSAITHLLIGGVAGAIYGAALSARLRGPAAGSAFGLMVWAVGYEAVMPAATDIAPAHRDERPRAATILVAHLIFGATLGLLMSRTRR